jgi:hypothetical protein
VTEPDGTSQTVEAAALAVVASRRALTAATRREDAEQAERAKHDYQLAQEAHRLALERLRVALQEDRLRAPLLGDAAEWLKEYLASKGGIDEWRVIKAAGHKARHSEDSLRTAQEQLRLVTVRRGYPQSHLVVAEGRRNRRPVIRRHAQMPRAGCRS